jgi:hypothetical protein
LAVGTTQWASRCSFTASVDSFMVKLQKPISIVIHWYYTLKSFLNSHKVTPLPWLCCCENPSPPQRRLATPMTVLPTWSRHSSK